ncbi:hypothetical protein [Brucella sp. IR073]|uniref:hypothetical protein n=1 Tax=unclassified Brucella TaxID=2632610 RepID=UPI003B98754B
MRKNKELERDARAGLIASCFNEYGISPRHKCFMASSRQAWFSASESHLITRQCLQTVRPALPERLGKDSDKIDESGKTDVGSGLDRPQLAGQQHKFVMSQLDRWRFMLAGLDPLGHVAVGRLFGWLSGRCSPAGRLVLDGLLPRYVKRVLFVAHPQIVGNRGVGFLRISLISFRQHCVV